MDNPGDALDQPAVLAALQAMFEDSIDEVDAGAPVPWCADWRVADLVEHLSTVHYWAAAMARSTDLDRRSPTAPRCTAAVRGPAEALALLVWGRITLDDGRLSVDGDEAVLTAVLADHFVP